MEQLMSAYAVNLLYTWWLSSNFAERILMDKRNLHINLCYFNQVEMEHDFPDGIMELVIDLV